MIRLWDNGVTVGDTVNERTVQEESPLPQPGDDEGSAVCEGPLLTALLNKIETLLDQVWVCTCKMRSTLHK